MENAITARQELNGCEIGGSPVKIGFAKVPAKAEAPISVAEALSNPSTIAGLAAAAVERTSSWPPLGPPKESELPSASPTLYTNGISYNTNYI